MEVQIFDGIRIIEFGWAVVGPLTTSWAGSYGARVIKVETKTRPDIIRSMTPFKDDRVNLDNSLFFGRENANKMSISLNLKHPEAVRLAKDLVRKSDVVLDSYTAGVMDRYGLGYEDLKALKPDIIMLSSCMYGQTGKLRSMPGYGVPLTAISGLTFLCGVARSTAHGPLWILYGLSGAPFQPADHCRRPRLPPPHRRGDVSGRGSAGIERAIRGPRSPGLSGQRTYFPPRGEPGPGWSAPRRIPLPGKGKMDRHQRHERRTMEGVLPCP